MVKVKVCGITSKEIAEKVCLLGADTLGFLVGFDRKSAPNDIPKQIAKEIVRVADKFSKNTFLLTKEIKADNVYSLCKYIGNSHVQLLGNINGNEINIIKSKLPLLQIVKVIHVTDEKALNLSKKYISYTAVDQLLLDSKVGVKLGGTGLKHDWRISKKIAKISNKP
ncbi:MAG: hypothetical protein R3321_15320, partial [Nitrososphaeraceae archaeon]|nr:hypothetical protein [Nitrososphaeraceae archaeon]